MYILMTIVGFITAVMIFAAFVKGDSKDLTEDKLHNLKEVDPNEAFHK